MVVVLARRSHLAHVLGHNYRLHSSMEARSGLPSPRNSGFSEQQQELKTGHQHPAPWHSVQQRRVLGEVQVAETASAGSSSPQSKAAMQSPLQRCGPPSPLAASALKASGLTSRALASSPHTTPHHTPTTAPVTPFHQQRVPGTPGLIPVPPTPAWDAATPAPTSCMGSAHASLWDPFTPWLRTSTKQPLGLTPVPTTALGGADSSSSSSQVQATSQQQQQQEEEEGPRAPDTGGSVSMSIPSPVTLSPLSSTESSLLRSAIRPAAAAAAASAVAPLEAAEATTAGSTASGMAPTADLLARRLSFGADSPLQRQQVMPHQQAPVVTQDVPAASQEEAASPSLSDVLRRHLEGSLAVHSSPHNTVGGDVTTPATSDGACGSPRSGQSTPCSTSSSRSADSTGCRQSENEQEGGRQVMSVGSRADALGVSPGVRHSSSSSSDGGGRTSREAAGGIGVPGGTPAESAGVTSDGCGISPASSTRSSESGGGSLEDSDTEGTAVVAAPARHRVNRGGGGLDGAGRLAPPASRLRRRVLLDDDDSEGPSSGTSSSRSNSSSRSGGGRQQQGQQGRSSKVGTQQQQQQQQGAGQSRRAKGQAAELRTPESELSASESEHTRAASASSRATSSSSGSSSAEEHWQTPGQQQQQQRRVKGANSGRQQQQQKRVVGPKGRHLISEGPMGAAAGNSSVQGSGVSPPGTLPWQTPPRLLQEGVGGGWWPGGKGAPTLYSPLSPAPLLDRTNTPGSTTAAGRAAGGQQLCTPGADVRSAMHTPPLTAQGRQRRGAAGGGAAPTPATGRRSSGGSGGKASGGVAVGTAQLVAVPRRRNTQFARQRTELAQTLYAQWNQQVFAGKLPPDLPLVWNPRLVTTAGQVVDDGTRQHLKTHHKQRVPCRLERVPCRLELSPKVLDCESRLRTTLAHEMCHVAAWVVDKEFHPHHGRAFKAWGARFQAAVSGVHITTRHDYQVFRPFKWECTNARCKKVYERSKQSIDPKRHVCSLCKGSLHFLGKFCQDGSLAGSRKGAPNAYSTFVQSRFSAIKEKLPPGTPTQAVMRKLADVWREEKQQREAPAATPGGGTGWVVAAGGATSTAAAAAEVAATTPRGRTPAAAAPVVLDLVSDEEGDDSLQSPVAGLVREQQQQQQQPRTLEEEVFMYPSLEALSIS